jgi:type I restriction enzyme, R subunit
VPVDTREKPFEASLLAAGGYTRADPADFDRVRCLDPGPLLAFVQATQPTLWAAVAQFYGTRADDAFLGGAGDCRGDGAITRA